MSDIDDVDDLTEERCAICGAESDLTRVDGIVVCLNFGDDSL